MATDGSMAPDNVEGLSESAQALLMRCTPPGVKYREIDPPNKVSLAKALEPPRPTLPRQHKNQTRLVPGIREMHPLESSLKGPARAGHTGTLIGGKSRYRGQVLAGRPDGIGQYFVKEGISGSEKMRYSGDSLQGLRHGKGTCFFANGETYKGDWQFGKRQGAGRMEYKNGDAYEGQWQADRRQGSGTHFFQNGDIFVGQYVADCREGLGTLYVASRWQQYRGEYFGGQAVCGSWCSIDDDSAPPLDPFLRQTLTASRDDAAPKQFPQLQLASPNEVLAEQIALVRKQRKAAVAKEIEKNMAAFSQPELEIMRLSFIQMTGSDGLEAGLKSQRLGDLCVASGLDPAKDSTIDFIAQLQQHTRAGQVLSYENFLRSAAHFTSSVS